MLAHAINDCANALQVRVPTAAAGIVRVADHVSETRPLAANCASLCHDDSSQNLLKLNKVSSLAESALFRTISLNLLQSFWPEGRFNIANDFHDSRETAQKILRWGTEGN